MGDIRTYHMNGIIVIVPLALLEEHGYQDAEVRKLCPFTTHTPIQEVLIHLTMLLQYPW